MRPLGRRQWGVAMRSEVAFALFLAGSVILCAAPREETTRSEEPRYDPATEINLLGTITEVREVPADSSLSGIHLMVKSPVQVFDVHLGPAKFIRQFEIRFAKGDEVHVTGSRVKTGNGVHVVLAREVRKESETLSCRRAKGEPNWE